MLDMSDRYSRPEDARHRVAEVLGRAYYGGVDLCTIDFRGAEA
jgi:hypothetical protein